MLLQNFVVPSEHDANVGDEEFKSLDSFLSKIAIEHQGLIRKLDPSESFLDGIRSLNEEQLKAVGRPLLTDLTGDSLCCCCADTVLQGQVGCTTKWGQTHLFPPGNYFWRGWGVSSMRIHDIDGVDDDTGATFHFQDLAYVNLQENNLGVAQVGENQYILGSGRYILRSPATMYGKVDVQSLKVTVTLKAVTEEAGECKPGQDPRLVPDVTREKSLVAGHFTNVKDTVTFARARPGFCYAYQETSGALVTGIGMTICRGGQKFIGFFDRQNYGRTTKRFILESKDRHEVAMRVQLRWRLQNVRKWIRCKGAYLDIFDAIEESAQAALRDAIAGNTYEECMSQARQGYEGIEGAVKDKLREKTAELGGILLGFEIRELRFPLLEQRNAQRAEKESQMSERLLEQKSTLLLEEERRKRAEAKTDFDMRVEKFKLEHSGALQVLVDQATLEKMSANATREQSEQKLALVKSEALLRGQEKMLDIELKTLEAKAVAVNEVRLISAKGEADKKLQTARAVAESVKEKAAADAVSKVEMAAADAKAAQLIGAAYTSNPAFLQLEMETLNNTMLNARAKAMETALRANPTVLMPVDLQREMAFLRSNITPIAPVIIPGGGGVVSMPVRH